MSGKVIDHKKNLSERPFLDGNMQRNLLHSDSYCCTEYQCHYWPAEIVHSMSEGLGKARLVSTASIVSRVVIQDLARGSSDRNISPSKRLKHGVATWPMYIVGRQLSRNRGALEGAGREQQV